MKRCTKCLSHKDLSEFSKDKYAKDGLDYKCKSCKAKIYSKIDKNERKEWRKEYFKNNKETELARCKIYRDANKERIKNYLLNYYRRNPGKGAAKTARYRSNRLQATPLWISTEQLDEITRIYENCPKGYHVDHIIPLRGKDISGLHVPWNLQYLPARINQAKGNRMKFSQECLTRKYVKMYAEQ